MADSILTPVSGIGAAIEVERGWYSLENPHIFDIRARWRFRIEFTGTEIAHFLHARVILRYLR